MVELSRANTVVDFTQDLLSGIAPSVARGRDTTLLRDLLDRSIRQADASLSHEPTIELSVRNIIGDALSALGDADAAIGQLDRVFQSTRGTAHHDDPTRIRAGLTIATILAGRYETHAAQKYVTECTESLRHTGRGGSAEGYEARTAQAAVYMHAQRHAEAETLLREVLAYYRGVGKAESEPALRVWNNLALTIASQNRAAEALEQWQQLNALDRRVYGQNHPYTLMTLMQIAMTLQRQGKLDEAATAFNESLGVARKIYDPGHPTLLIIMNNLGAFLLDRDKLEEADALLMEAYQIGSQKFQTMDVPMDTILLHLGRLRGKQGRYDEAAQYVMKLHDASAAKHGRLNRRTLSILKYIFDYQIRADRAEEGIRIMQELGELPEDAGNDVRESVYASAGKLHLAAGNRQAALHYEALARSVMPKDENGREVASPISRELHEMLHSPTTRVKVR
jgi:tetratricopeptide (TPR) repeat protein